MATLSRNGTELWRTRRGRTPEITFSFRSNLWCLRKISTTWKRAKKFSSLKEMKQTVEFQINKWNYTLEKGEI